MTTTARSYLTLFGALSFGLIACDGGRQLMQGAAGGAGTGSGGSVDGGGRGGGGGAVDHGGTGGGSGAVGGGSGGVGRGGNGGHSGRGGSSGKGGGSSDPNCRTPEQYLPGQCDPTFAQQKQRAATNTCSGTTNKVYTGECAGYTVWLLSHTGSLGDPIWCFFDTGGALVGETICSDTIISTCNGHSSGCVFSGSTPTTPPMPNDCPAGALTSVCDRGDAGSN